MAAAGTDVAVDDDDSLSRMSRNVVGVFGGIFLLVACMHRMLLLWGCGENEENSLKISQLCRLLERVNNKKACSLVRVLWDLQIIHIRVYIAFYSIDIALSTASIRVLEEVIIKL